MLFKLAKEDSASGGVFVFSNAPSLGSGGPSGSVIGKVKISKQLEVLKALHPSYRLEGKPFQKTLLWCTSWSKTAVRLGSWKVSVLKTALLCSSFFRNWSVSAASPVDCCWTVLSPGLMMLLLFPLSIKVSQSFLLNVEKCSIG